MGPGILIGEDLKKQRVIYLSNVYYDIGLKNNIHTSACHCINVKCYIYSAHTTGTPKRRNFELNAIHVGH